VDGDCGHGRKRIEINLLTCGRMRVEPPGNARGVVAHGDDLILRRFENPRGESFDVEPFQRGALLQHPKIEIETVNVDDCAHKLWVSEKAKAALDFSSAALEPGARYGRVHPKYSDYRRKMLAKRCTPKIGRPPG